MSDLVIDADIMRAAGTTEHPVSKNAREILEQIRERGYRLVQTREIKAEYVKPRVAFCEDVARFNGPPTAMGTEIAPGGRPSSATSSQGAKL